ncbi:hypothetical protein J4461_03790 [Candidatus Pacearchaeota archaeon]|nr:hypothetical protein [Candidatus Pacearchaeota archaeon]
MNTLLLTYKPLGLNPRIDFIYEVLTGERPYGIGKEEFLRHKFELCKENINHIPPIVFFYHEPSKSTIIIIDFHRHPRIKIIGENVKSAHDALVALVNNRGFKLIEDSATYPY